MMCGYTKMDGKFSSKAKILSQTIKKLNQSWTHNNAQILLLLDNLMSLMTTLESIENTMRSHSLDEILFDFPNLMEQLLGSIMIEIEDSCLQIKQFMILLGDIEAAMKQSSLECTQLLHEKRAEEVIGLNGQAFVEGHFTNIDSLEAILNIQKLQHSRSYEYHRKESLLHRLFFPTTSTSNDAQATIKSQPNNYSYWLNNDQLRLTIQQWNSEDLDPETASFNS